MKLPSSTREQQALIGVLVSEACCHSADAIIECERLGINESHFGDPERTLWLEIVKADRELRPFDLVSLCGHLERTRNGDGTRLSTHLTECATKNESSFAERRHCSPSELCQDADRNEGDTRGAPSWQGVDERGHQGGRRLLGNHRENHRHRAVRYRQGIAPHCQRFGSLRKAPTHPARTHPRGSAPRKQAGARRRKQELQDLDAS